MSLARWIARPSFQRRRATVSSSLSFCILNSRLSRLLHALSLACAVLGFVVPQIMVKYVRREVRTLTDADRESFFDALHVVYSTSQGAGQKQFGSKFRSIE